MRSQALRQLTSSRDRRPFDRIMPEPFSSFMRRALFDPEHGYYSRNIRTVGAGGDFSTTATLSPMLGSAIACWVNRTARTDQVRSVIEVGGGDGSLMRAVRKALPWWSRRRLRWRMVETSPALRRLQQATLPKSVVWHEDLKEAILTSGGKAVIYHNELLDAFPCELLEWDPTGRDWKEVWVTDDRPHKEQARDLSPSFNDRSPFTALCQWKAQTPPPVDNQRVETHTSVRNWLQGWAPAWTSGSMLTIDYGDTFPKLYHRRPKGTVRGYLRQQRTEGSNIYLHPGQQDLTADINFSDYRKWCCALGWRETGFGSLRDFLKKHGHSPSGVTDAQLLAPGGAADAFKFVLHHPA